MIDLHLHLDGSLNPDNILNMADMSKISLPYEDKDELYRQLKVSPTVVIFPNILKSLYFRYRYCRLANV